MVGAILIVIGLYSVLWGKHKEQVEIKVAEDIPLPVKGAQVDGNFAAVIDSPNKLIGTNSDQRAEAN